MKLSKKIDIIREELNSEIKPINYNHILDNAHITPKNEEKIKFKQFSFNLKTVLTTLLVVAIIIPFAIKTTTVDDSFDLDENPQNDSSDLESDPIYDSLDQIYGFVATSAVALINSSNDVFTDNSSFITQNEDLLIIEELSALNRYLFPIEMMLSDNNHFYRQKSDNSAFTNKIVYEGKGLFGENILYQIYYNERLINSTSLTIDCIVVFGNNTIRLYGLRQIINNNTILQMTYYINEDNHDYIQVEKNINDNRDSYDYMIVKDDIVINKSKLTLVQNNQYYAKLENIISTERKTIFNIYSSSTNKFSIEYSITKLLTNGSESTDSADSHIESGSIKVDVEEDTSSFYVFSNNVSNVIDFKNSIK